MNTFLLTLVILAASTIDAAKLKRDILPGDSRYGTPYHLEHQHSHGSGSAPAYDLKNYLPPNTGKETIKPPSTAYGVPFNKAQQEHEQAHAQAQAQADAQAQAQAVAHAAHQHVEHQQPAYQAPIHYEEQHVQQPAYVQQPVKTSYTPHQTYGVPAKTAPQPTYQPLPVYEPQKQVPMILPAPTPVPVQPVYTVQQPSYVKVQPTYSQPQPTYTPNYVGTSAASVNSALAQSNGYAYQKPQVIPAPAPVKQVIYQPVQQTYTPVQPTYQQQYVQKAPAINYPVPNYPAPSVVPIKNNYPSNQYGAPGKVSQPSYQQVPQTYVPVPVETPYQYYKEALPVQDNLIFEAPIKAIEVAQTHSVEHGPINVPSQTQVTQDAVSLEVPVSKAPSNEYVQPVGSNGGYLY